jgi:hypothetical protein
VLFIVVMMAVILAVCVVVVAYVAFPHLGEQIPGADWLGAVMAKAADALPTIDDEEAEEYDDVDEYADHQ